MEKGKHQGIRSTENTIDLHGRKSEHICIQLTTLLWAMLLHYINLYLITHFWLILLLPSLNLPPLPTPLFPPSPSQEALCLYLLPCCQANTWNLKIFSKCTAGYVCRILWEPKYKMFQNSANTVSALQLTWTRVHWGAINTAVCSCLVLTPTEGNFW